MIFGLLKDIKEGEGRVIATPAEISMIVRDGHAALVQKDAGRKAGFPDEAYAAEGAEIVGSMEEIYARCDFVAKVKEIEPCEYPLLRENQIVFCCIHPAAHRQEVDALLERKVVAFTAEDSHRYGSPNCEAAGVQGAINALESMSTVYGGKGKLVCGLAGAPGLQVMILGGGIVGKAALHVMHALGAWVTVLDVNVGTLRAIGAMYQQRVNTLFSTQYNVRKLLPTTDIVLNCVKWPKENKEHLITRDMLKLMEPGSVLVDISSDVQGAIESYRETTHENPRYVENGVVHYCVGNIPGAVPQSTSVAYAASVYPHFKSILNHGVAEACVRDGFLRRSLTTYKGVLTHEETSAIQNRPWRRPETVLDIEAKRLDPAPPATGTRSENFY
jgi:Alanine dehydrogenase